MLLSKTPVIFIDGLLKKLGESVLHVFHHCSFAAQVWNFPNITHVEDFFLT